MIITKAEELYSLAEKIIRPYTIYTIVRENYEHKDFKQGLWEMWNVIGELMDDRLKDKGLCEIIDEISDQLVERYWKYIDSLTDRIRQQCSGHEEEIAGCLNRIEEMKKSKLVDERSLEELRKIEEIIY